MAQYHVKNTSHLDKAFKVRGGHQVIPAGKNADVLDARELTEAQIDALARDKVKVTVKGPRAKDNGGNDDPAGPEAKHRGAGSYSIMEGDAEIRDKLTRTRPRPSMPLTPLAKRSGWPTIRSLPTEKRKAPTAKRLGQRLWSSCLATLE